MAVDRRSYYFGYLAASLPDELATGNLLRGAGQVRPRLAFALGGEAFMCCLSLDGRMHPARRAFRRAPMLPSQAAG